MYTGELSKIYKRTSRAVAASEAFTKLAIVIKKYHVYLIPATYLIRRVHNGLRIDGIVS